MKDKTFEFYGFLLEGYVELNQETQEKAWHVKRLRDLKLNLRAIGATGFHLKVSTVYVCDGYQITMPRLEISGSEFYFYYRHI